MNAPVILNRRELLQLGLTVTGLTLGVAVESDAQKKPAPAKKPPKLHRLNLFVQIATDGVVTVFIPRVEVGQSVHSTLAMLIAEELDADWNTLQVKQAPLRQEYGEQQTQGMSVTKLWEPLRQVGATAKERLIREAALRWQVGQDSCHAKNGIVTHKPTGRKFTYGQLAERAAMMATQESVPLKPDTQFTLIGKPVKRRDTLTKINGAAVYGMDLRLPGMLFAATVRPHVPGTPYASIDDKEAKKVRGVRQIVTLDDSGVAVVADNTWAAIQGRNALKVTWKETEAA
jgi:isoquinoline 1-oxidoreductase beta subunit